MTQTVCASSYGKAGRQIGDQLGNFSQILFGGGRSELVSGSIRAAQSQSVEFEDALEVSEQHLDLFSLPAGDDVGVCFGDRAGRAIEAS